MSIDVGRFHLDHWQLYEANDSEGVQLEVFLSTTLTHDIGQPNLCIGSYHCTYSNSCTISLSQNENNIDWVLVLKYFRYLPDLMRIEAARGGRGPLSIYLGLEIRAEPIRQTPPVSARRRGPAFCQLSYYSPLPLLVSNNFGKKQSILLANSSSLPVL